MALLVPVALGCGRVGYDLLAGEGDGGGMGLDGEVPPDATGLDGGDVDAGSIDGGGVDAGSTDGGGVDAGTDAGPAVDGGGTGAIGPFGTPNRVPGLNTSYPEYGPTATADLLEMYFTSDRAVANDDIYRSTRASTADAWGAPVRVAELSSEDYDATPEISPDGLTMWFASDRTGGMPQFDIYVSTRASRSDPWGTPVLVSELTSGDDDVAPAPSADGLRIMFHRYAFPSYDILEATRGSTGASWGTPALVTSLNTSSNEGAPFPWGDARTVVFDSNRSGGAGSWDLYVATRPTLGDTFDTITPISGLNTAEKESDPWVSPDGSYILFTRGDLGVGDNGDIWEARR